MRGELATGPAGSPPRLLRVGMIPVAPWLYPVKTDSGAPLRDDRNNIVYEV